ncbi:MAG: PD-(D/E)XK nuclease family protein [Nitriliruptorales bacterium]|nr:PD-(D/E)XK nuclease family protein [Nitriliruptorales bacterium]
MSDQQVAEPSVAATEASSDTATSELVLLDDVELGEFEPETPPLIDAEGRVRLSFSRIDTYRRCPAQFRYGYVDRLPGVPAPALSFGTSIHGALEAFYDRKLPEPPSEKELLDALYEAWDSSGFGELTRDEQLAYYRHAQQVLLRFRRRAIEDYRLPMATEAWFELPLGDEALVVGAIDRVDVSDDGDLRVVDYKTNRRVKNRARVAGSLQLAIYALACEWLYGRLPVSVSLDFVVAGVEIELPIDDLDLDGARAAAIETARGVRNEAYEPTPNRLCGWCDFRSLCPAWEGEGPEALGPATEHARTLRRRIARDLRELREMEAGIERIQADLAQSDRTPAGQ